MTKNKIKIHIRNNHWKKGHLPCDLEGEKNSSVPKDLFESKLNEYPEIKDKITYLVDCMLAGITLDHSVFWAVTQNKTTLADRFAIRPGHTVGHWHASPRVGLD